MFLYRRQTGVDMRCTLSFDRKEDAPIRRKQIARVSLRQDASLVSETSPRFTAVSEEVWFSFEKEDALFF